MSDRPPRISDELAARLTDLLGWLAGDRWTPPPATLFIEQARKRGIGVIDITRRAFLVDQTVHAGVLWRLAELRRRHPPRRIVAATTWRGLPQP